MEYDAETDELRHVKFSNSEIMFIPWYPNSGQQLSKLDLLQVSHVNSKEGLERLLELHDGIAPKEMKYAVKHCFETNKLSQKPVTVNSEIDEICYGQSPIYWFLQALDRSRIYAIPLSSFIRQEMAMSEYRNLGKELRERIISLFQNSVKFVKTGYANGMKLGVDDLFPVVTLTNYPDIAKLKTRHVYLARQEKLPFRMIPIFNLPFIYCQYNNYQSLEIMNATIENLDKIYKEEEADTNNISAIAYIRLMKLQMAKNLSRVANLFATRIENIIVDRDYEEMKRFCRTSKDKINRMKKRISACEKENEKLKERNEKLEEEVQQLKRKIDVVDQRSVKLGPKFEE